MKTYLLAIPLLVSIVLTLAACVDPYLPGEGEEAMPPSIKSVSPENEATDVLTDSPIVITFNKGVSAESVSVYSIRVFEEGAAFDGQVAYNESDYSAVFIPADKFKEGRTYSVYVSRDVRDEIGIPLDTGGKDSIYSFSFTVVSIPPEVIESFPAHGAADVSSSIETLSITFSEPMDAASINRATLLFYDLSADIIYDEESYSAYLYPKSRLLPFKRYSITVTRGARDKDGVNISKEFTLNFTTGAE